MCQVMADFKQFDGAGDSMKQLADAAGEEPFNYKLAMIKRGDIVGIRGFPGKSKKGELSIFPVQVSLRSCASYACAEAGLSMVLGPSHICAFFPL